MALKLLLSLASFALPAAAFALPGAKCHADPCLALVRKGAHSRGGRGGCHAFFAVTIVPATVTSISTTTSITTSVPTSTETAFFTETSTVVASTDTSIVFETDTVTFTKYRRRTVSSASSTTMSRTDVPPYAQSVCASPQQYSSACSCVVGATYSTTTAPTPTSTVLVTEASVVISTSVTTTSETTTSTTQTTTSTTTTSRTTVSVADTTLPSPCPDPGQQVFYLQAKYPNFPASQGNTLDNTYLQDDNYSGPLALGGNANNGAIFYRDTDCNLRQFIDQQYVIARSGTTSIVPFVQYPGSYPRVQVYFDENNKVLPRVQGSTTLLRPADHNEFLYLNYTFAAPSAYIDVYAIFFRYL